MGGMNFAWLVVWVLSPDWLCPLSQTGNNAGNTYVRSYIGNGVGGDWFSENVTLSNRISGT
jgi:hypothetical protein